MDIYLYALLSFSVFLCLINLLTGESEYEIPQASYPIIVVLGLTVVIMFSIFPPEYSMDKLSYQDAFDSLTLLNLSEGKDLGFNIYSFVIKQMIDDSTFYFTITAFLYVLGYFVFARSFIEKQYAPFLLITCFVSFGFSAYAINTLRGGLAISFLLIAISCYKKQAWFLVFSLAAILCHKSMLLPFIAFYLTGFYNTTRIYGYFWLLCLLISFLDISFISNYVQSIIGDSDDRFIDYLSESSLERYATGFRVDFVIYSAIPILLGRYYLFKLKLVDGFYLRIFNTYLFANAIWLLVIRMAFTDRMAYLSWFLIPFILLYPVLKYNLPINRKKWVFFIILGIFSFTSIMYFK